MSMDKQTEFELLNIVSFAILMENGEGIMDKSPKYILEKFQRYCQSQDIEYMWGLDWENQSKLKEWIEKWLKK